ncbi:MAG: saccharopine dehydrogenase NADP-binding domain-containing protein [Actinobacteria bacterium]|nr:saccharopine dehydrogenase NADP-binding domain-containing protein [Actinomycetota bacterium]
MQKPARVLVIGLGSVSQCALPLLFRHVAVDPSRYTVIDCADVPADQVRWVTDQGAAFVAERLTEANHREVLARYLSSGDVLVDLAWNLGTVSLLDWCHEHGVRYVNASVEVWDPYAGIGAEHPTARTLYARHMELRRMFERWGGNRGPSAVLDHGANPGLVSHFTKVALADIAAAVLDRGDAPDVEAARDDRSWNRLAETLGVKVIHISERDTQISDRPKREDEFVNTWSVEGFYEEGIAPAELGWGTHERALPGGAYAHEEGPANQICLAHPGYRTWVRSWVPAGGIVGMVIRHGEAFSISEHLTVWNDGGLSARYRPTVNYAYCPADAAIASLHELQMRGDVLQTDQRIMNDDIVEGRDELGVLLMGHALGSWWVGSLLDIHEARRLVPGQNATTLQVAAGVLGAVQWLLEHPEEGVRLPDELPHELILEHARPYLGPFVSRAVDWSPLAERRDPFAGYGVAEPDPDDVWRFSSFLVRAPFDGMSFGGRQ